MTSAQATCRYSLLVILAAMMTLALHGEERDQAAPSGEAATIDWDRIATLVDVDRFWALVDEARKSGRSPCAAAAHLPRILARLSPDEILAFELQLRKRFAESHRWDLWAVAYIVNGGASNDGFEYFRGWLIAQGREYFETALRDPERAADKASRNPANNECEEMLSPGFYAYWSRTRQEMPAFPPGVFSLEPAGQPWDEAEVDKLYPRLAARFGAAAVSSTVRSESEAGMRPTSGIEIVLALDPGGDGDFVAVAEILRTRLRTQPIAFAIEPEGDQRLLVRIPPLPKPELDRIKATLTRTGFIEFRLVHPHRPPEADPFAPAPDGYEALLLSSSDRRGKEFSEMLWVKRVPELTGAMIAQATAFPDQYGNRQIAIRFTAVGRERFAEVTQRLADEQARTGQPQRLGIVIDGRLYSAPTVYEPITGGSAEVSGNYTARDAIELVNALNNPLQVRLRVVEERPFGP